MTDSIAPALTPEEWKERSFDGAGVVLHWDGNELRIDDIGRGERVEISRNSPNVISDVAPLIAVLNAALPDTDPRKITWAMVEELEEAVHAIEVEFVRHLSIAPLRAIIDALASYLPPRKDQARSPT